MALLGWSEGCYHDWGFYHQLLSLWEGPSESVDELKGNLGMGTVGLWCQPGLSRESIAEDKNICVSEDIPSACHEDSAEDIRVNQFFFSSKYKGNKWLVFKNLRKLCSKYSFPSNTLNSQLPQWIAVIHFFCVFSQSCSIHIPKGINSMPL